MGSSSDFNAELHARPSIYFDGPAFVEHVAIMPGEGSAASHMGFHDTLSNEADVAVRVERHTEFVTVTRLRKLSTDAAEWPASELSDAEVLELTGIASPKQICRVAILVVDETAEDLPPHLARFGFGDTAPSRGQVPDPRYLHVPLQPLHGTGCLEVWRSPATVSSGVTDDGITWASDGELQFGVLEMQEPEGGILLAGELVYRRLSGFWQASGYPHLLRIWNYLDAIILGEGDHER